MSEAVQIALINQLPNILTAFGIIITAIIGGFTAWLTWHVKKNTDGMTSKMVDSAHDEGKAEGKAQEQAQPTSISAPLSTSVGDRRKGIGEGDKSIIGEVVTETRADVKEVKQDVKDLKAVAEAQQIPPA